MRYLVGHYDVSQRRACRVVKATRSLVYYRSRQEKKPDMDLLEQIADDGTGHGALIQQHMKAIKEAAGVR